MPDPIPASVPAIVTGASSGIGEEFARQLAARGHDLTLVARRTDRLRALAKELRAANGVSVHTHTADLSTAEGRAGVARLIEKGGPWLLVNNAGYGSSGKLVRMDPQTELEEVQVNVVALHELTLVAARVNAEAGGGAIINLASTAAYQAIPHMATYAATKAFVLHFTEALAQELHGTGSRALALCPGPTKTEFAAIAENQDYFDKSLPMSARAVIGNAMSK